MQTKRWLTPVLSLSLFVACDKPDAQPEADTKTDRATNTKTGESVGAREVEANPACADKVPDFTNSSVPTVYGGALPANGADLAVFAWQHFVALNWESANRGQPDPTKNFFETPKLPVWSSYKHRNEQFPATLQPNGDFNSAPAYNYANVVGPCDAATDTNPNEYVNLDEASQLGLDYVFAKPSGAVDDHQILFEAKVNESYFTYIVDNGLYDTTNENTYQAVNSADLASYGAICQTTEPDRCSQEITGPTTPPAGYCLPCDDASAGNEGTIHVKAAWRKLTDIEVSSGHYLTAPVVLYQLAPADGDAPPEDHPKVCYSNAANETWGLVGLHIIHKTQQFPAFMFASWEHVENETSGLTYENTAEGGPEGTVGERLPWNRAVHGGNSLPSSDIEAINTCTQSAIKAGSTNSIWQYYQLVGVQGTPVDFGEQTTDLPDYYLANNVIESNDFFQSFSGNSGKYSATGGGAAGTSVGPNVTIGGQDVNGGGCQGCHGNAQRAGTDMSFLGGTFASNADAFGDRATTSAIGARLHAIGGRRPRVPANPGRTP